MNVSAGPFADAVEMFGVLAALLAPCSFALTLLVAAILAVFRKLTRRLAWIGGASAGGSIAIVFVGWVAMTMDRAFIEDFTRERDLETLARNSESLLAAIHDYEADHGEPPRWLKRLVPDYLPVETDTGLSSWPHYEYRGPQYQEVGGWSLIVWIPKRFLDMDGNRRFSYEPDRSRDSLVGATLRRGDWVYIPD